MSETKRVFVIPDTQLAPGVPTDHIGWCAEALVEYRPDTVVMIGDFADMSSLSSYEKPGGLHLEGLRIKEEIDFANEQAKRLVAPMEKEIARRAAGHRKRWQPRLIYTQGNHEQRLDRIAANDAKMEGLVSSASIVIPGFERHPFLEIVEAHGILFSHYFQNVSSGKPIGGSVDSMLNRIGKSFVQGHRQGFQYSTRQFPGNRRMHGLVAGSFYLHDEGYRGLQGNGEWRGCVVLNETFDGSYDIMPLSMSYLQKKFG